MGHREVEVSADRLVRFMERFAERNACGDDNHVDFVQDAGTLRATAADGTVAELEVPFGPVDLSRLPVAVLARHVQQPRTLLAVLVRRGGYGAAVLRDGAVVDSKHGTKYVQSRTAAGGWSQQRYQRRRGNQAVGVVAGAVAALEKVLERSNAASRTFEGVVPAGDELLLRDVLSVLPPELSELPHSGRWDISDPRRAVTEELAKRVVGVRVKITDP